MCICVCVCVCVCVRAVLSNSNGTCTILTVCAICVHQDFRNCIALKIWNVYSSATLLMAKCVYIRTSCYYVHSCMYVYVVN